MLLSRCPADPRRDVREIPPHLQHFLKVWRPGGDAADSTLPLRSGDFPGKILKDKSSTAPFPFSGSFASAVKGCKSFRRVVAADEKAQSGVGGGDAQPGAQRCSSSSSRVEAAPPPGTYSALDWSSASKSQIRRRSVSARFPILGASVSPSYFHAHQSAGLLLFTPACLNLTAASLPSCTLLLHPCSSFHKRDPLVFPLLRLTPAFAHSDI